MASEPLLHIKDSYYFDVPRQFWRARYESAVELADRVGEWTVRNDDDYQDWEADRFVAALKDILGHREALNHAKARWRQWQHADPHRRGRAFDLYIEDALAELDARAKSWVAALKARGQEQLPQDPSRAYLAEFPDPQLEWMQELRSNPELYQRWLRVRRDMNDRQVLDAYLESPRGEWSAEKLQAINYHLSGKVFIPQPFGTLRNAYERESGFAISKYMVIEVIVAMLLLLLFRWLASRVGDGRPPRGKFTNMLESMVSFVRTDIAAKVMDPHDIPRFMPLLWTLFFFILGCNLMGMLPWMGSPTAAMGVTGVLALIVFLVGTVVGVREHGVIGYLKGLCPELGLPVYLAVVIVPMVWLIEFFSLFIKHTILAIRLLANMAAGHLVLLGILGLAFGYQAVSMPVGSWSLIAVGSLLGTTILSFMELFVAFLQAYVFTLLAALFIGSAVHGH
ncbi:MAG: hypothetical protein KatS3mg111_0829 [Pirellulaceae bacterium]|nr:MAG: hypothetical protein KatS3mg111_0829 [Pirellulaceae bacterium]